MTKSNVIPMGSPRNLQDLRADAINVQPKEPKKSKGAVDEQLALLFVEKTQEMFEAKATPLTPNKKLRFVQFKEGEHSFRIIEQNPRTNSEWAMKAASGAQVAQVFHQNSDKVLGVVVDSEFIAYDKPTGFMLADVDAHEEIDYQDVPSGKEAA